jgi:hypothetical protein
MDKLLTRVFGIGKRMGKVFGDYEGPNPVPHVVAFMELDSTQYCPVILHTLHGTIHSSPWVFR